MYRFLTLSLLLFAGSAPSRAEEGVSLLRWQPKGFDFSFVIARRAGETGEQAAARYVGSIERDPELAGFAAALRATPSAQFSGFAPGNGLNVAAQAIAESGEMNDLVSKPVRMHRTLDPLLERAAAKGLPATAMIRLPNAAAGLTGKEAASFEKNFGAAFDGFVIPGSPNDVSPALYGQTNKYAVNPNLALDKDVVASTRAYLANSHGKLYTVCFGMQVTSVGQGGSLVQDLPSQLGDTLHQGPGGTNVSHGIVPASSDPASPIARIFGGKKRLQISWSDHHEAVVVPKNSASLRVAAWSDEKNPVVEGVEYLDASGRERGFGLQFHPERDTNPDIPKRVYDVTFDEMDGARKERVAAALSGCPGLFSGIAK
jgi:gamma-glutamyl-gamma-aminobutyrate hydrolase PuuD